MGSDQEVNEIRQKTVGSVLSGSFIGKNPSKEDIREEVLRLKSEGKGANSVGQQIGVFFMVNSNYSKRELDLLEEVLSEEFADYGK